MRWHRLLGTVLLAQSAALPPGAVALVNEDRFGSQLAVCVETAETAIQQGARRIRPTEVWAGDRLNLERVQAGVGACDPAWSPDGRYLAVTAVDGLWIFPVRSTAGSLYVAARVPFGEPMEFSYRAFSQPEWSPDGRLLALVVSNGGTSWVDVFESLTGRLIYTSPPEHDSFSWGRNPRHLKIGSLEINLPYGR
jgi:dipeptidyl aminopeptidase/acylaminoacyl peptidase